MKKIKDISFIFNKRIRMDFEQYGYTELTKFMATEAPLKEKNFLKKLESILQTSSSSINVQNTGGKTALMFALTCYPTDQIEVVKLLLKRGADPNLRDIEGLTALMLSAQRSSYENSPEIVKLLVEGGADPNIQDTYGWNGLITAVSSSTNNNSLETVKLLLDNGADVNMQDYEGETALMNVNFYTSNNASETVKLLLERGADITLRDNNGDTILMKTIHCVYNYYNSLECMKLLLEKGTDVNLQNNDGQTVLMLLVSDSSSLPEFMKLLLENGADINLQDNKGKTALMIAVRSDIGFAKLLLKGGADIDLRDNKGRTAIILSEDTQISNVLTEYANANEQVICRYIKDVGKRLLKKYINTKRNQLFFHPDAFYSNFLMIQNRVRAGYYSPEKAFAIISEKMKDYFGVYSPDDIMKIKIK